MTATLTHVVFRVTGEPLQLAAFDARLKLLFAEHGIADGVDEQHAADLLHYDLKVAGGIPFPPFALASADFPELAVAVEWVDTGSGVAAVQRLRVARSLRRTSKTLPPSARVIRLLSTPMPTGRLRLLSRWSVPAGTSAAVTC